VDVDANHAKAVSAAFAAQTGREVDNVLISTNVAQLLGVWLVLVPVANMTLSASRPGHIVVRAGVATCSDPVQINTTPIPLPQNTTASAFVARIGASLALRFTQLITNEACSMDTAERLLIANAAQTLRVAMPWTCLTCSRQTCISRRSSGCVWKENGCSM
jgi:hypothetical protein